MLLEQARDILKRDGSYADLLDAVGTLATAQGSSPDDLALGLRYPGIIADQAALALYHRTGRKVPRDPHRFVTDRAAWAELIRRKPRKRAATRARKRTV